MWTPWAEVARWGRVRHERAVENARVAAIDCSRAWLERLEVELYIEDLLARRERTAATA